MVVKHRIKGYEDFITFITNFKNENPTFILFMGSESTDGNSWCPDCVTAHPFIEKGIESAPETYEYIFVEVGDRSFWKDRECPFRTNSKIKVQILPTLIKWGTQKRLEGDQLLNIENINMLLEENDE